ncbi:MAG: type III secretion system translocon subunit SctB [Candidatus Accumulibacter sp.]|jgi:hypothetical protein|nr:type III secretion system translocon subunit SctB [Accumulibacter sp.]
MSSISNIQQAQNFDPLQYQLLMEQAKAQGVGASQVDAELLAAINGGKDFTQAVNQVSVGLPQLAPPNGADNARIAQWGAVPSPAALIMSLITEQTAEQRQMNAEVRAMQTEAIVDNIENQADKMREKATEQLALGIVSGTVQIASGLASMGAAAKAPIGDGAGTIKMGADARSNAVGNVGKGASSYVDAINQYMGTIADAEIKEMQADEEKIRAMRDTVKEMDDSLKELIQKMLSSSDSIQQLTNQSRAKILG